MRTLNSVQLLMLDDWGLETLDAGARRDLYEILEERYGRRSTILTSQVPVDKWHQLIGDRTYADAILDRIVQRPSRRRQPTPDATTSNQQGLTAEPILVKTRRPAGRLNGATSSRNSERHDPGMTRRHRRNA